MIRTIIQLAVVSVCWLLAAPAIADHGIAEGAPAELAHWSKLIGEWTTTEEGLAPDGSEWQPSNGADWNFYWSYDGWGIRDDYTSPPMSEAVDDESTRQRGTNLRIFNPTTNQWVMTWLATLSAAPQNFTAMSTEEHIVMLSDRENPQGFFARITFFDVTESSFEWKLEWSKDKEQWMEVYRIHGTREAQ